MFAYVLITTPKRERYAAIYVWKILDDMVHNILPPMAMDVSEEEVVCVC